MELPDYIVKTLRQKLDDWIKFEPQFEKSLTPSVLLDTAPAEAKEMAQTAARAGIVTSALSSRNIFT